MEATVLPWIESIFGTLASLAVVLLVVINAAFVLAVIRSRSRAVVDRWTKPVVIADAALLLALVGAPVATAAFRLGAKGVDFLVSAPSAAINAAVTK